MPTKIGMFLTFTNRTAVEPPKSKPVLQPKPVLQTKPVTLQKQPSTMHSMRSIMRTPRNGCSSCGH